MGIDLRAEVAEFEADEVFIRGLPVGRYALRIVFSDGHDSGLYNWDQIRKLTVGD